MDLFKDIGKNIYQWSPKGWAYVTNIVTNVTIKVGLYLLTFFLIMEIAKIYQKANNQNNGHVEASTFLEATIYALLAGALVSGSLFLLQFMGQISVGAIKLIQAQGGNYSFFNFGDPSVTGFAWNDFISDTGNALKHVLTYLIEVLCNWIAWLVCAVIVIIRWFQLYLLTILAPISFSTFASSEYRSIGIAYVKNYFGYLLQGVVLIIIFGLYNQVQTATLQAPGGDKFLTSLIAPITLIVLIIQSNKIAKYVVGLGL